MGNTLTGRTSQKTPCISAERCYFPSSAPEHNPVHCKQHLALLNSASVPTVELHTICTAFRGRLLFPLIFGLQTQTAVEGFRQEGKGQETSWTPLNTPTSLLWRNESQGRDPALGWCRTLNCLQEGSAVVQHDAFTSQVQMDASSQWEGKQNKQNKEVAIGSQGRSTKVVRELKFIWRA